MGCNKCKNMVMYTYTKEKRDKESDFYVKRRNL